jgi:hypothetical protein
MTEEQKRLDEHNEGKKNWLHWGCYLSERQWGTVREDYSAGGDAWNFIPHHEAISRAYRWGEDGIAGICDEQQFLCFALSFWNGKDVILKERLFGLTNGEGNHGEDVKELYYYLDNTPTHSYMKYLYKYPHAAFPYDDLVNTNAKRTKKDAEYELLDTGIFDEHKYFDIETEYAKADEDDILIKITISNRGNDAATLHLLPTLWFRNTWKYELTSQHISMQLQQDGNSIVTSHEKIPPYYFYFQQADRVLFTDNKNNKKVLFGKEDKKPFRKDSFHKAVIKNDFAFLDNKKDGTKAAPLYVLNIAAHQTEIVYLRISKNELANPFDDNFEKIVAKRKEEADSFYADMVKENETELHANLSKQAMAGMLWSKQFYYYDVQTWLHGDHHLPPPPKERLTGRNAKWKNFKAADVISMPDKWEYPWFAAWDLSFHSMALAKVDVAFAKKQLLLLFSKNYFGADGQLPAYEWNFSDVNPPVQAIAALEICRLEQERFGRVDYDFLKTIYPLLLQNYNWWISVVDVNKNNVFEGGFLGLDNISVFDRSYGLPEGGRLDQADGTAWMAMFSLNMLELAIKLSAIDDTYQDYCIAFFDQFVKIASSLQQISSAWLDDDTYDDGFFYDVLQLTDGRSIPIKLRSIGGIIPLFATCTFSKKDIAHLPKFAEHIYCFEHSGFCYQIESDAPEKDNVNLSLLTPTQLKALLPVLFSEKEMLAPGGIRSISKIYEDGFVLDVDGVDYGLKYLPAESDNRMYGGNSNWRGPVWMPLNYLVVRSLQKYAEYYENDINFNFEEKQINIEQAAAELSKRLINMFLPDENGRRMIHGNNDIYATKHFEDLILFYEHFDAENSRGVGASHQTGWTGLAALL